jgi:hypothetical protein
LGGVNVPVAELMLVDVDWEAGVLVVVGRADELEAGTEAGELEAGADARELEADAEARGLEAGTEAETTDRHCPVSG